MDTPRDPAFLKRRKRRRWLAGIGTGAVIVALRASAPETAATAVVVRVLLRRRMCPPGM